MKKNLIRTILVILLVTIIGIVIFNIANNIKKTDDKEISFKVFIEKIEKGNIKHINDFSISDNSIKGETKNGEKFYFTNPQSNEFKRFLLEKGVKINKKPESDKAFSILLWLFQMIVPLILFIGLVYYMMTNLITKQYTAGNAEFIVINDNNINFSDVAGNEEAKENMNELVEFLNNPQQYSKYGIRPPKGTVLFGPPGTGKTLLAKALAGTAKVSFVSVSGSDFVEKFVGVGASRIRQLFELAKKNSPCIVFIDEIDALGKRSSDGSGANSERDQTLNQLLVEIDGFSGSEGIIVIAATNRLDMLDPALIRSGRFDRQIQVNLPDVDARYSILKLHANGKPLSEDVNLKAVAQMTMYMSGADLYNVMNEAGIFAIRNKNTSITMSDIDKAICKIYAGEERKNRKSITIRDKKITAFHEAGHALVAKLLSGVTVSKVTIIPTTKGAGGYTMYLPDEKMFSTKKELLNEIGVLLAGRASEEVVFGESEVTNGASHDLKQATDIASNMVCNFGMSEVVGLVSFSNANIHYSSTNNSTQLAEREVKRIIEEVYLNIKKLIEDNRDCLLNIANELLEKETIYKQDIDNLVEGAMWKRNEN